MKVKVGVVGATGEVGRTMVKVLEEFNVPVTELRLFASERSVGKEIEFKGEKFKVELLTEESMKWRCDYLLFSAGASVSKKFAPIAAENGVTVIDNSSAFRLEKEIPLVVPEVNAHLLKGYTGIIANPNCSTIQMILSIYKASLFELGFEPRLFAKPEEALEWLKENKPNIMFTDLNMPGLTGIELTAKTRQIYKPEELTIIMVTTQNEATDNEAAKEAGVTDILYKPFTKDILEAKIKEYLK